MIKFKTAYIVLTICILTITKTSHAETFCASSSSDIQSMLNIAASNGQADHIQISQGTYLTQDSQGFQYTGGVAENYELKISGGWAEFFGQPCGHQPSKSPFVTTLNANFMGPVMNITASRFSDVIISSLLFRNGFSENLNGGAGLILSTDITDLGDVLVEYCAFFNNEAYRAAALQNLASNRVIVRNNLFALNQSELSTTVQLVMSNGTDNSSDSKGIYFTNNTIVTNSTSDVGSTSGLFMYVDEYSKAFIANNIFWGNEIRDLVITGNGYKYLVNNNIGVILGIADEEYNNTSITPRFEAGLFNYKLSASSALIDAGIEPPSFINNPPFFDETWSLGDIDIDDNSRVLSGQVDIGAYESPYNSDIIYHHGFEMF